MANTVKMKQSSVAGKAPTTAQLALGELAINTYDGKLYLKKSVSGTESIVDVTAPLSGTFSSVLTPNGGIANGATFNNTGTAGEGGELHLQKGATSTLSADLAFDLYNQSIRFFENGGTNRGASLDISAQAASVGSVILTSTTSAASFPTLNQNTTGNAATATTATNLSGGSISSATSIGIGGAAGAGQNFTVGGTFASSGTGSSPVTISGTIPSATTASYASVDSLPSTQAASFTLTNLIHFRANYVSVGFGSSVTAQFGFLATASLTAATYNYGFYGNIAAGTGRYNFYAAGTADNYFAGNLLLGTATGTGYCRMNLSTDSGTTKWDVGPRLSLSTNFYILNNQGSGVYIAGTGNAWTAYSDERLKTDLKPIENAAEKVSLLRAVTGRFKRDEEGVSRSFLIAQDVQAVLPEAVDASDPEKLGVAYTDTIPLLVAAIKELTARLENVEVKLQ